MAVLNVCSRKIAITAELLQFFLKVWYWASDFLHDLSMVAILGEKKGKFLPWKIVVEYDFFHTKYIETRIKMPRERFRGKNFFRLDNLKL